MSSSEPLDEFADWLYLGQVEYEPEDLNKREIEIARLAYEAGKSSTRSAGHQVGIATDMPGSTGFTFACFSDHIVPPGTGLYTKLPGYQIPEGYKLVPDFKVGMRVKFNGREYKIFAIGDKPGTFDICLPPGESGDRWLNIPPNALEIL